MSAPWQECPQEAALECAPEREGLIVRLFDQEGLVDTNDAKLRLFKPVASVMRTNLIEQNISTNSLTGSEVMSLRMPVGHHAIETFRLDVGLRD